MMPGREIVYFWRGDGPVVAGCHNPGRNPVPDVTNNLENRGERNDRYSFIIHL